MLSPASLRTWARSVVLAVAFVCIAPPAWPRSRPLFEPTDLELEQPGTLDFDFQLGVIRGQDAWRAVNPDFEFDLGLARNVELDVDGSYAISGTPSSPFLHPQATPDALWTSVKLGLVDWQKNDCDRAAAIGIQIGPKYPIARGDQGLGAEGLVLSSIRIGDLQLVLNTGALIDPRPSPRASRPAGIEVGLDARFALDRRQTYAVTAEASTVRFFTAYPNQLLSTLGLAVSPSPYLDISVLALLGWLDGSDRYGALIGFSPKLRVFEAGGT